MLDDAIFYILGHDILYHWGGDYARTLIPDHLTEREADFCRMKNEIVKMVSLKSYFEVPETNDNG